MTDMYDEKVKVFQGGSMKPYPAEAFGVEVSSFFRFVWTFCCWVATAAVWE
jgi:hypothetical protein